MCTPDSGVPSPPRTILATEEKPLPTTARDPDPYWQPLIDEVNALARAREDDPATAYRTLGRFELIDHIGSGGMGVVFRARDPQLDRVIALKLWNCHDDKANEALLNEALCQAKVTHAHVVTIFETGMIGSDVYLAMEYVPGEDGREWFERHRRNRGHWTIALAVLTRAGAGLAAVHGRGLVHADFKPENLLFGADGNVRVADFGVARVLDELDVNRNGDGPGTSGRGTVDYMAPERLERRWTDQRSDQFSFCVTVWEFVYGRRPFLGETVEQLLCSMVDGPKTGDTALLVPSMLRAVLLKGLALDPDERFDTMGELLVALGSVPFEVSRSRRRRFMSVGAVVVGFAGVFGGMAIERARSGGGVDAHEVAEGRPGPTTTIRLGAEGPGDLPVVERSAHTTHGVEAGDDEPDLGEDAPKLDLGTEPALVDDETSQRKRDELEADYNEWMTVAQAANISNAEAETQSITASRAFYDRALELESTDPRSALVAAGYALGIATSLLITEDASTAGTAAAEVIVTETAVPKVADLRKRVRSLYPQSKQITVPSTVE